MVVRAEDGGAAAAGANLERSIDGVARAERDAAAASGQLGTATEQAAGSQRRGAQTASEQARQLRANAQAINEVVRATNPAISTQSQLDAALRRAQSAYIGGRISAEAYARAQQIAARATAENVQWQQRAAVSTGQARAGSLMLGQQIQDVGMQLALGTDFMRVFAMQAGQTALAIQQMGGRASGFATFIGGPWGSLILAGISVLALFATRSQEAETAQLNLADAADTLGRAQSLLGNFVDLVTGKITSQNEVVREAIILQTRLAQLQSYRQAQEAGRRLGGMGPTRYLDEAGRPSSMLTEGLIAGFAGAASGGTDQRVARENPGVQAFRNLVQNYRRDATASVAQFRRELEGMSARGQLPGLDMNAAMQEAIQIAIARQEYRTMGDVRRVAEGGPLPSYLRRPGPTRRTPRGRDRSGEVARLEEFGEDARDRLSNIAGRFSEQPRLLEQVRQALQQVDDLVDDIERRKPPNWRELVQQAESVRNIVQAAVDRPFRDMLDNMEQQLATQRLVTQGRGAEAEALQIINRLEREMGPLSQERKDAILAGVDALRQEERQLEINRQKQEKYLEALGDVRSLIIDTIESGFRNIADVPRRLIQTFNRLSAEFIFERLFGDAFRRLEARIKGERTVEDAADKFRQAVDRARVSTANAATGLDRLATAATNAANAVEGQGEQAPAPTTAPEEEEGDIVVTGTRVPRDPQGFIEYILRQAAEGILGRQAAEVMGRIISKAIEGAAIGQAASGIARMAGVKQSNTGAMIGGVAGRFGATALGLPPELGAAVGGLIGGTIGGLLKSTPKASATLTNAFDDVSATGSRSLLGQATGLGRSVQESLRNISDQLGAQLGAFNVSIGVRDGKYRVDPTGRGNTKTKKGAVDFGDDETAAVAYAVMDAIRDGAVQGLSRAVQQALQSTTDVDRALREALKVQELEDLIGGIGGKLSREFKNFDKLAAERVRLATKYGLDLLAVEKINAEERADLVKQVTEDRIGSAMQFLKDLKFGDLFEGDASTRRSLILDEIAETQKEAEAGINGAADRLVELYRRLISTSEEAFGTAGPELTGDRAAAKTGIERVIELENKRIAEAQAQQAAQTDALKQNNVLTGETNDLLSMVVGKLDTMNGLIGSVGSSTLSGSGSGGGLAKVARFTDLNLL